ncbi:ribbon-helix-helix protein, CopG family [Nocardioides sp.]|uniref:ribbon-helix-helix protein, CopG family n=1 Tax=Nocardioides sp. TaxID=35761 RepID=UPI002D098E83|nr:ribbon-helix-helix protein, CopG family [Nocardioides sp.]HXH79562.1 ribbon-helix-helix protein, CopG family [Nocardioides sp.]
MATMAVEEKVSRITAPTASFSLTVSLIAWIEAEARKRGISKSELVRQIIDGARQQVAA